MRKLTELLGESKLTLLMQPLSSTLPHRLDMSDGCFSSELLIPLCNPSFWYPKAKSSTLNVPIHSPLYLWIFQNFQTLLKEMYVFRPASVDEDIVLYFVSFPFLTIFRSFF